MVEKRCFIIKLKKMVEKKFKVYTSFHVKQILKSLQVFFTYLLNLERFQEIVYLRALGILELSRWCRRKKCCHISIFSHNTRIYHNIKNTSPSYNTRFWCRRAPLDPTYFFIYLNKTTCITIIRISKKNYIK